MDSPGVPLVDSRSFFKTAANYITHDPITVTSDAELAAVATDGSGSVGDPYIIEGWLINKTITTNSQTDSLLSSGINISYTSKHFIIRDCWIDSNWPHGPETVYGICIHDVAEGTATITGNKVQECAVGIVCNSSSSVMVVNNTCERNNLGIATRFCSGITISNNSCSLNLIDGVTIAEFTSSTTISWNLFYKNDLCGVTIAYGAGIENIQIHHNTFERNRNDTGRQGSDDTGAGTWYDPVTKEGNYWSNWGGTGPYSIFFDTVTDPYPLSVPPVPVPNVIYLPPTIIYVTMVVTEYATTVYVTVTGWLDNSLFILSLSSLVFVYSRRKKMFTRK